MVERELRSAVTFMNDNGLLHFDSHFGNVLTDGRRLYLTDFGLATSPRFELTGAERAFVADNSSHDRCHALTQLVNWLVTALNGASDRGGFIRRCADGGYPVGFPPTAAAIVRRHAPVAVVVNDFYRALHTESRTTTYPADRVRRAMRASAAAP
jgi:hypothetical protein